MHHHAQLQLKPRSWRAAASLVLSLGVAAAGLPSAPVRSDGTGQSWAADGVVEALRHADMAVQVAGTVTQLPVKAGDSVRAGQLLARIDARAAEQSAAASSAQAEAARATLDVAKKDYERQKQLFARQYISPAAMDRAEAQFKAARANTNAQLAAAGAARTQSGYFDITAPYAGLVADVPASIGYMAMPGRALLSVYDPHALRVSAELPQAQVQALLAGAPARIEFPSLGGDKRWLTVNHYTVLPTADASTHTVQIRAELPLDTMGIVPGTFARVWLQGARSGEHHFYVPTQAIAQRAEMSVVYVVDASNRPQLRQVRLGHASGAETEVLAGVAANERVALDPIAAAQVR